VFSSSSSSPLLGGGAKPKTGTKRREEQSHGPPKNDRPRRAEHKTYGRGGHPEDHPKEHNIDKKTRRHTKKTDGEISLTRRPDENGRANSKTESDTDYAETETDLITNKRSLTIRSRELRSQAKPVQANDA